MVKQLGKFVEQNGKTGSSHSVIDGNDVSLDILSISQNAVSLPTLNKVYLSVLPIGAISQPTKKFSKEKIRIKQYLGFEC